MIAIICSLPPDTLSRHPADKFNLSIAVTFLDCRTFVTVSSLRSAPAETPRSLRILQQFNTHQLFSQLLFLRLYIQDGVVIFTLWLIFSLRLFRLHYVSCLFVLYFLSTFMFSIRSIFFQVNFQFYSPTQPNSP